MYQVRGNKIFNGDKDTLIGGGGQTREQLEETVRQLNYRAERVDTCNHQADCNMVRDAHEPNSEKRFCTCFAPEGWVPNPRPFVTAPRRTQPLPSSCVTCKIATLFGPPTCTACREQKNALHSKK